MAYGIHCMRSDGDHGQELALGTLKEEHMRIYRYVGSFSTRRRSPITISRICITRGEVLSWRKGMLVWVQEMDVPLAGKFALLLLLTPPQLLNWGQGREKGSMTPRRDRPVGIRG